MERAFNGFRQEAFDFLLALGFNNNKAYFEENRQDFVKYVQDPLLLLAARLEPLMQRINPQLVTLPRRTISRIHRDTRFSPDKTPYRNHMWISYKYEGESIGEGCGYYFEINPDGYSYGMGMYGPQKERMDDLRRRILANPAKMIHTFTDETVTDWFTLRGEDYKKKVPGEEEAPKELLGIYRKRSFYYEHGGGIDDTVKSANVAEEVEKGFTTLAPIYKTLNKLDQT